MNAAQPNDKTALFGSLYALGAFGLWGIFPLYFKAVGHVAPLEILSHRVVWTVVLVALLLTVSKRWGALRAVLANPKVLRLLVISALLISANWFVYIWAVNDDRVLETSLGYFINPLVNVLLGVVFLRERLRVMQWAAVLVAALGVLYMSLGVAGLPWVALLLAFSFGFYGLIRKLAPVDAFSGLFIETAVLAPIAMIYLATLSADGTGAFVWGEWGEMALLVLAGVVTGAPLICFAEAAKRLALTTVGFFQYLAPTCHMFLAIYIFDEAFTTTHIITFGAIWAALVLYTLDAARFSHKARKVARASANLR